MEEPGMHKPNWQGWCVLLMALCLGLVVLSQYRTYLVVQQMDELVTLLAAQLDLISENIQLMNEGARLMNEATQLICKLLQVR